jgi:propionyl-CoA synthetase
MRKPCSVEDQYQIPATIDDPAVLDEIGAALKEHGIGAA